MGLKSISECPCPKTDCSHHSKCALCALEHKNNSTMPYCLFVDNGGDNSIEHYYKCIELRYDKNI